MIATDVPEVEIGLGLSVEPGVSLVDLFERCFDRRGIVVSGLAKLEHLSGDDVIWRSRISVKDGRYQLRVPIEPSVQLGLAGLSSRQRTNRLKEYDVALQDAVDKTTDGVQATSRLVSRVAKIMATSPHAQHDLEALEDREGVDTRPARRFIASKQEDFLVTIESTGIPFCNQTVRSSQQVGTSFSVVGTLVRPASPAWTAKCDLSQVQGQLFEEGLPKGGRREIRFAHLKNWQVVALQGALQFGRPVKFEASDRIGTCSLKHLPADVTEVTNWNELLAATITELQAATIQELACASNEDLASGHTRSSRDAA